MDNNYQIYSKRDLGHTINWQKITVDLILFTLLPPIIGLPYIVIKTLQLNNKARYSDYLSFMICIALYFAAINATKMPGGDQINYYFAYKNVPELGFFKSLVHIYGLDAKLNPDSTKISGEFMNGIYNYLGYYITLGYYPLFEALLTFSQYILVMLGFYHFSRSFKTPHIVIITGCLIFSFFYLFFVMSLQIQKQILAQCIMMYVLGKYSNIGKMTKGLWCTAFIAFFTHASTGLFLPLLYYKPLKSELNKKTLFFLGFMFFLFIYLGPRLASNVVSESNSALSYGVNRFAQSEGQKDTINLSEEEMLISGMNIAPTHLIIVGFPILIIVLKSLFGRNRNNVSNGQFILNTCLLLLLSIIAMTNQPLAQYRYFMMLYAFIPFIYPFAFNSISRRNKFLKILSMLMIIWFYMDFEKIIWEYASEVDIIIKSPILLILSNYHNL